MACPWARTELDRKYHDEEWGVPVHEDRLLFEMITLEGAQAGLNWSSILKRREGYRAAFESFDVQRLASWSDEQCLALLANTEIIRNRAKIFSVRSNAQAFMRIQESHGSFDCYLWRFVDGEPVQNAFQELSQVPAKTPLSDQLSKELKQNGFGFMGSTICYAFMQAVGMVNDHLVSCPRYLDLKNG